jgi:hypothetical protein
MLILKIVGPTAWTSSVLQTDEIPHPIILDSDDQQLVIQWFNPTFSQPLREQDELSISAIADDYYTYTAIPWQAAVYSQPLQDTDEVGQPKILDEEFSPSLYTFSLTWKGYTQPPTDTDEVIFVPATVVDDDLGWNQTPWATLTFRQPSTDTDEISVPVLLEDDIAWLPPSWQAIIARQPVTDTEEVSTTPVTIVDEDSYAGFTARTSTYNQPVIDTDEVYTAPLTFVDDDLTWVQVSWQVRYFSQPVTDTDEVSVPAILDEELWVLGFPRYLGYLAFAQPYADDDSFHYVPVIVTGNPTSLLLDMSMMRLGGRAF